MSLRRRTVAGVAALAFACEPAGDEETPDAAPVDAREPEPAPPATPADDPDQDPDDETSEPIVLPQVHGSADILGNDREVVWLFGTYERIHFGKRRRGAFGQDVLRLADTSRVFLDPPAREDAVAAAATRKRHDGQPVVAMGVLIAECVSWNPVVRGTACLRGFQIVSPDLFEAMHRAFTEPNEPE